MAVLKFLSFLAFSVWFGPRSIYKIGLVIDSVVDLIFPSLYFLMVLVQLPGALRGFAFSKKCCIFITLNQAAGFFLD